jgi:hypothetical protein
MKDSAGHRLLSLGNQDLAQWERRLQQHGTKTSRLDNLAGVWALLGADHTNNNDKRKSAPALSSRGHRFELATKLRCRKNRELITGDATENQQKGTEIWR